jgi:hypothetical protein
VFRHHARKLVLALALLAVASSSLPTAQTVAAAPAPVDVTDAQFVRKPNLRSSFVRKDVLGSAVMYVFKVENIGTKSSGKIDVQAAFTYTPCAPGATYCFNNAPGEYVESLAQGESKLVHVFCNGQQSPIVCSGAAIRASIMANPNSDADLSNNYAQEGVFNFYF